MGKKGYYITQWSSAEDGFYPGPAKKINGQIKALRSYGLDIVYVGRDRNLKRQSVSVIKRIAMQIYSRLPFTEVLKDPDYTVVKMPDISNVRNADFLYIRFWWGDYQFGKAMQRLREQNPSAIIFLEFPDYPYRQKALGIRNYYMILKDRNCSRKYKGNIDYAVTMDRVESIYGIPVQHMYNGIDTERIKKKQPLTKQDKTINIGFVATAKKSHGIDRLIKGMRQYYNQKEKNYLVKLILVGGGSAMESFVKYAEECNMDQYVEKYGYQFGNQLDYICNSFDMAVDYLAIHRDGYEISSSLKSREYLARGIPIITSAKVDICEDFGFKHILSVESSEMPIDINEIIEFYEEEYKDGQEAVVDDIRAFAEEKVDMKVTMQFVPQKLSSLNHK